MREKVLPNLVEFILNTSSAKKALPEPRKVRPGHFETSAEKVIPESRKVCAVQLMHSKKSIVMNNTDKTLKPVGR